MSKKRESQTIDLLIARLENEFLFDYIALIQDDINLYSFSFCLEAFDTDFIRDSNDFVKIQLKKELIYDKSCSKVIPPNLRVVYKLENLMYSRTIGVLSSSISLF